MARSSRHKSSKHGSREAKDYSDSEKDLLLKGSSSSRAVKESASSEKRKLDLKLVDDKELVGYGGVELGGEYGGSSSKRRKEKVNDDRWISGDSSEHAVLKSEASMKEYKSRSSRRDDDLEVGIDGDEGRKNGRKADSKHHRSDRKERGEKEGGSKHERKGKEVSKSEKLFDGDRKQGVVGDERGGKHASITDINVSDEYRSTEPEKDPERHALRKRDGSGDGDKRQKSIEERNDKHLPSRDDTSKSKKHRDDSHRDKRAKDGYRDEVDKENRHLDAHDRDGHGTRDHTRDRSDDKHLRNEKNDLETQGKKSKPHNYDYDRDHDHGRHDHDHDHHRDRERDDRDHGTDRDRERERGREREREHDRYRRERDRERGHIHDRDYCYDRRRDRDHDHDRRYSSHADERNSRHKDERGRRRSPDDYDNYYDEKSRSVRGESVARKERTLSHKARVDNISSGNQREPSPSSRRYDVDKFRDASRDSTKLGDSSRDRTSASNTFDGVSKKRLMEKSTKSDDNKFGNFPEKSPSTKTYPVGFRERSPSTTSLDRRFSNRTGQRRSLDVDEADWRSSGSNDVREGSINDDRQSKELSVKKSKGDENSQVESPFYQRSSQARVPGPSSFKAGADSPLVMGTQGENSGFHPGSSYRRSSDPNVGRGHGNAWNSAPNWAAPLPNGFMPIPHGPTGPHHGGFPTMIPQFPPPLFGVRPSMEMNHPGLPYHIAEADRFSSHLRPPEWQMGGSRYPSFHGWDANNGIINNEPSMYGPPQMLNGQGRDTNVNSDVALGSQREGQVMKASADETSVVMDAQGSHNENSYHDDQGKSVKTRTSSASSPMKETPLFPSNVPAEKTPESFNDDDNVQSLRAYLSKLDISIKLSDPEVYNQCVNVAVEENNGYLDEDLDGCEFSEEVASLGSEASKFSMDTTLFPVVEDSIFKRAMDMYNALRKPLKTPNGENLDNFPSPSTGDPIQTPMLIEKGNNPVQPDEPKSQDELLLALPREVLPPSANEETNMDKPEAAWCHENEGEIPNPDVNGEHSEEMGSDHAVDDGHDCAVEVVLNNTVPSTPEPNIASHVVKTDAVDDSHDCAVEVTLNSTVPSAPDLNTASHVVKTDALDSASCAADEVAFNGTIPSSPDPNIASGVKTGTMDSACCAAVEEVPFNSTVTSGPDLNTASHGVKTDVVDSASCAVSSPSILSHGPVNVCEALMSVSNVSESLVISRIHHAPESTR